MEKQNFTTYSFLPHYCFIINYVIRDFFFNFLCLILFEYRYT
jgi:hypothetical protein